MSLTSIKLKQLNEDRHILIRQYDRKELDTETYKLKIKENDDARKAEIELLFKQDEIAEKEKNNQEPIPEVDGMADKTESKKEETKTRGKNPRADSYTMLIIEALKLKSLKTIDAVVDKVEEKKPGRDKAKIKNQVKSIIRLVKKQSPARWQKYAWDEESFMLTEK